MIATLLVYLFLGLCVVLVLPFLILWSLITGSPELMYAGAMRAVAVAVRIARVRVQVEGIENIPPGACIFASNHASNFDPLVLFPVIPGRVSVLLKKQLERIPILATGMKITNFVFLDRSDRTAASASLEQATQLLKGGLSFAIYAEGTRSSDGRLGRFRRGAFVMAAQAGAPVVPVALGGTQRIMRKGSWRIYPGDVTVRFAPALDPAQFSSGRLHEMIAAAESAVAVRLPADQQPLSPNAAV
jgi:1-acyl-sn-glycerol-3-phosphate acyltransferase